ncbi:hypothetical protein [Hymenobacter sp. UYP22]|uniref:hypothetical protein n=1 Tax=Hymenobacter sp. UYP22 TaxID=3156348 RepID=UPI00339108B3
MATGQPDETTPSSSKPLTKLQAGFAHHFARLWKAAPAYRLAGGAENGAKQNGQNLLKDERIQAAIKAESAALGMTVEESTVRMSEWGRVTIDDVMTKEVIEHTPRIKKRFADIVEEFRQEIDFEQRVAIATEALLSGKAQTKYRKQQAAAHQNRKIRLLRMEMELERNPKATRWVDGPTVEKEVVQLDLVKVHDLKAGHMIKKVTPTRYGTAVELHDAKDAVNTMLKIHGAFAPVKVDHTTNGNDMPGSNIMMPDNGRD